MQALSGKRSLGYIALSNGSTARLNSARPWATRALVEDGQAGVGVHELPRACVWPRPHGGKKSLQQSKLLSTPALEFEEVRQVSSGPDEM
jgi:hypothetical protein